VHFNVVSTISTLSKISGDFRSYCITSEYCFLQAPAAFGLVSFLMHAGLERNRIRKHLLVFALAAPVMSMVTYLGLSKVGLQFCSAQNVN